MLSSLKDIKAAYNMVTPIARAMSCGSVHSIVGTATVTEYAKEDATA
jgi:hypothetical protein